VSRDNMYKKKEEDEVKENSKYGCSNETMMSGR
jgi:hypothetical protein